MSKISMSINNCTEQPIINSSTLNLKDNARKYEYNISKKHEDSTNSLEFNVVLDRKVKMFSRGDPTLELVGVTKLSEALYLSSHCGTIIDMVVPTTTHTQVGVVDFRDQNCIRTDSNDEKTMKTDNPSASFQLNNNSTLQLHVDKLNGIEKINLHNQSQVLMTSNEGIISLVTPSTTSDVTEIGTITKQDLNEKEQLLKRSDKKIIDNNDVHALQDQWLNKLKKQIAQFLEEDGCSRIATVLAENSDSSENSGLYWDENIAGLIENFLLGEANVSN